MLFISFFYDGISSVINHYSLSDYGRKKFVHADERCFQEY